MAETISGNAIRWAVAMELLADRLVAAVDDLCHAAEEAGAATSAAVPSGAVPFNLNPFTRDGGGVLADRSTDERYIRDANERRKLLAILRRSLRQLRQLLSRAQDDTRRSYLRSEIRKLEKRISRLRSGGG